MGAILAGGRAARLERPKAIAPLAGRPLLEFPRQALENAGLRTVVVAKRDSPLPPNAPPLWEEPDEPVHPLLGIVTALERAQGRALLACACDTPFLTPRLVAHIARLDEPLVIPRAGGRLHPLLARYTPSLLPALREGLERSAPLHETISALEPRIVEGPELAAFGDPARLLFNVNTPADLELAETMFDQDA